MKTLGTLTSYVATGALAVALATSAQAQESGSQDGAAQQEQTEQETASEDEQAIVVTGSLIQRTTNSDISPVTVITSEDMAAKGLMTLGDVMKSFTENDGVTQGKQSNLLGRFTFGAEEVNFRGLGTGRTLLLVNGRRIADYPLPFGGEQNGADLGTIPYSAISRIEYLASGASATYGSDAVGGVVNITTKRDMEQTTAELTTGIHQQGYGETARLALSTGNSFARGSYTIGVEGFFTKEVLASQPKYFRDSAPFNASMVQIIENSIGGQNSIVPEAVCAPLSFEFNDADDSCVSNVGNAISLTPTVKQGSGFFDGRYELNDDVELFATVMASVSAVDTRSNVLFWEGVVGSDDNSAAMFVTRGFSEDELGVSDVGVDNTMWSAVTGAKGRLDVGNDSWIWDVAFTHARFNMTQKSINLKEEGIRNWILSGASSAVVSPDQQNTFIVDADFYNNQLLNNIVRGVQPSDVSGLIGTNVLKANSTASSLLATLNGKLGDLGVFYAPIKFGVRAEYGHQTTEINPDERTLNTTGEGWFNIGTLDAKGSRDRWALAAELDTSVLSNLDVVLSGRYDHYDDASSIGGRLTGQARFMFRPTDWLKVRGGYGQTFRAPDMFNIYGRSDGFEFVPDFSAPGCYDGTTYVCGFSQVAVTRQADPGLGEEYGDDLGLGIILTPTPNFTITADWYSIHLNDLVITESSSDLVLKEWQCNNDVLDGASLLCADVRDRVVRNGFGQIERVVVQPINQSNLSRQGIDVRASLSFESETLGQFSASLGYSQVLKFKLTRFEGDEPIDLKYGEPGLSQPANNMNASLTWSNPLSTGRAVSVGLFADRSGRVYNYSHTQFLDPYYNVNLTAGYQFNVRTQMRLSINNLLNSKPQSNDSGFWPGFWSHLQTAQALGRSGFLTVSHSFN